MSSNTTWLVLGANGQLGWELQRALAPLGTVVAPTRTELELTDASALRAAVESSRPAAIFNASAYTAVDRAESEPDVARAMNASLPALLAELAKASGAPLVHYSTDYVFDGSSPRPYVEEDEPNPLSVYGRTKLEGELAVGASGASFMTLRVSWLFSARGANFLKTILRLAREREDLSVVDDQVGAPTAAEFVADVTAHAILALRAGRIASGTYHLTAAGETSWCRYARFVVAEAARMGLQMKLSEERIRAIPSEQYAAAARRPRNSWLNCQKIYDALGVQRPPWQAQVARTVAELARS